MITMLRALLLSAAALLLCMPRTSAADALWTGPVFDAHLHYNEDAAAAYLVGTAFELSSTNGVKAVLANSLNRSAKLSRLCRSFVFIAIAPITGRGSTTPRSMP